MSNFSDLGGEFPPALIAGNNQEIIPDTFSGISGLITGKDTMFVKVDDSPTVTNGETPALRFEDVEEVAGYFYSGIAGTIEVAALEEIELGDRGEIINPETSVASLTLHDVAKPETLSTLAYLRQRPVAETEADRQKLADRMAASETRTEIDRSKFNWRWISAAILRASEKNQRLDEENIGEISKIQVYPDRFRGISNLDFKLFDISKIDPNPKKLKPLASQRTDIPEEYTADYDARMRIIDHK